jgi:hypothetical protein
MTRIGVVIGTGPSLSEQIHLIPEFDGLAFTCNNTYKDIDTDVWLSCDPSWHDYYGQVEGDFDKWHWSKEICDQYGYRYVEGVWVDGLWMQDKTKISLNHCSGAQLLNLACNQYECDEVLLLGHDFHYKAPQRHYFSDLSETAGEYPKEIRKFSKFDKQGNGNDLLAVYKHIADQKGPSRIVNCTPGTALPYFEMGKFEDYIR